MSILETIPKDKLLDIFRKMLFSRRVEERLNEENKIPGRNLKLQQAIGQEAVGVGACAQLRPDDYIRTSVRPMPEMIGKGCPVDRLMAEHFGKVGGFCKGRCNPIHFIAVEYGMMGGDGSLGAGIPIGTGLAMAAKMQGKDQVVIVFFGDATSNEGRFHEGLNFASTWKAPIVFLCSNNLYGDFTPLCETINIRDIADRAAGYGIPGVVVDGMDVLAVYEAVGKAVARARAGEGPTLIEAKTYRFCGAFEGDPQFYRSKEEVQEWMKKDPIDKFKKQLIKAGILTEKAIEEMDRGILKEIDKAVKFALESPFPKPEETLEYVWG